LAFLEEDHLVRLQEAQQIDRWQQAADDHACDRAAGPNAWPEAKPEAVPRDAPPESATPGNCPASE
jgi:hypothetical protein